MVTGATGFTGSHLARALLKRGAHVRALVRDRSRASKLAEAGAEIVEGDLKSYETLTRAVEGASIIFNVAALFRQAKFPESEYFAVNAEAPRSIVQLAASAGVCRVVHCSTIGVHGATNGRPVDEDAPFQPGDVYQASKLAGEVGAREEADQLGVPLTIVRPASIYGPGDRRLLKMFSGVARRRFPMIGSGNVQLHPAYVDDVVDGMLLAATRDEAIGRTYILGGAKSLSLNELVRTIAELAGVPPPRIHIPVWPVLAAATLCEAICVPLRIEPPLYRRRVAFFTKSRSFDISRARRELGYEPRFSWQEGAERTLTWYRAAGWL